MLLEKICRVNAVETMQLCRFAWQAPQIVNMPNWQELDLGRPEKLIY